MTLSTDITIVGAGPVGLFAVFELGLLGIKSHLIDTLPEVGGQCSTLYPEKPIYDIPGVPKILGQELIDNLMTQIRPFKPTIHLGNKVMNLRKNSRGKWIIHTNKGVVIESSCVVIATGTGIFAPKKIGVKNQDTFLDKSLFYNMPGIDTLEGKKITIAGGGDSALDWVLEVVEKYGKVTLIHRREEFRGFPGSVLKVQQLMKEGKVRFLVGQITALNGENGTLRSISVSGENGSIEVDSDVLCIFYGMDISRGFNFHLSTEDDRIPVDNKSFETRKERLFAIGDANIYPGKLKLILCGFHEAALMSRKAFEYVFPEKKFRLEYTTASSTLKKRLGII